MAHLKGSVNQCLAGINGLVYRTDLAAQACCLWHDATDICRAPTAARTSPAARWAPARWARRACRFTWGVRHALVWPTLCTHSLR